MNSILEKTFKLKSNNTTFQRELLAGFTTFITMAYIIFVNPQMMASSGMDYGASFVGTCLAAALACFAMGIYSNWPVGLAPGMASCIRCSILGGNIICDNECYSAKEVDVR